MAGHSALSSKALGKRPAKNSIRTHLTSASPADDAPSPASADFSLSAAGPSTGGSAIQTRQKRILPARTRRGGPGFGNCDADQLIIDSVGRKGESEPLIPPRTTFILTTDSSFVPIEASNGLGLNSLANERYFDRPEVIQALKEQQEIQTPEYEPLTDDARVGGRLRVRGEEETPDLSDAAYERRHRKFENHEKRQKLREKEKLQHDHYKLKERIEQLRGIDSSAFLGLPSTTFGEWDRLPSTEEGEDGSEPIDEGEWRRNIVLNVATGLEERYRFLLPNEKKAMEKARSSASMSMDVELSTVNGVGGEREEEEEEEQEPDHGEDGLDDEADVYPPSPPFIETASASSAAVSRGRRVTLRLPPPPAFGHRRKRRRSAAPKDITPEYGKEEDPDSVPPSPEEEPDLVDSDDEYLIKIPIERIKQPSSPDDAQKPRRKGRGPKRNGTFMSSVNTDAVGIPLAQSHYMGSFRVNPIPALEPPTQEYLSPREQIGVSLSTGQVLSQESFCRSISTMRVTKKRERIHTPQSDQHSESADDDEGYLSPAQMETNGTSVHSQDLSKYSHESNSALDSVSTGRRQRMPAILVAASHNEGPESRKTSRSLMAFGVKFPALENMEFDLPDWLDVSLHETFAKAGPTDVESLTGLSTEGVLTNGQPLN